MTKLRLGLVSLGAIVFSAACAFTALAILPTGPALDLSTVSGRLEHCDAGFCVNQNPLYFGPDWYLRSTRSVIDYDRDGNLASLFEELAGAVGRELLVEVEPGSDQASVYVVNGVPWRELEHPAPWAVAEEPVHHPGDDQAPTTSSTPPTTSDSLVSMEGLFESCDSSYCLAGARLHFGPWWFLGHTDAAHDYDGDGTIQTPAGELQGLIGTQAHVEVRTQGGIHNVITLNGLAWRAVDGPPPWAGGPSSEGPSAEPSEGAPAGPPAGGDQPPSGGPGPPANPGPPP